jgi:hypothetical protein
MPAWLRSWRKEKAGRLQIAPVTVTSETLLPEYRAAIAAEFHAPLVDNFASTEGPVGASPTKRPIHAL